MIKLENLHLGPIEPVIRGMRNPMNSWEKSDSKTQVYVDPETQIREVEYLDKHVEYEDLNVNDSFVSGDIWNADVSTKIGPNDLDLMTRLADAGSVHAKYRRMMTVFIDITAPLYWWKEFDTYKVGTVANSCSTMHKIQEKEFTLDDFSCEHLISENDSTEEEWDKAFAKEAERALQDKYCTQLDPLDGYVTCFPLNYLTWTIDMLNRARGLFLKTKDKRYWWQMIQLLPSSYNQKRTVMLNYEVLANIYEYRKDHKLDEWREFCKWIETLPYSELITGVKAA